MRVSYITMQFPIPSETFASNDVKNLIKQGIDVNVFTLRRATKNHRKLIRERGLKDVEINSSSKLDILKGLMIGCIHLREFMSLLFYIIKGSKMKKIDESLKSIILLPRVFTIYNQLLKNKPDIVHLFWGHYPSLIGYLIIKFNPDIKLTIFLGAYDLEMKYNPSYFVAKNADKVFTHSKVNLPILEEMGVPLDKICVSYRGVNFEGIPKITSGKIAGKIVTAGRLIDSKGFEEVITFFSKVVKAKPYITLNILGDGPKRSYLENFVKELGLEKRINFLGHVSHDEVFKEMAESEYFLFFSKKASERLPNVVKEAMYTKNICFVTETPGIDELIEDGVTGYVRKVDSIDEFAEIFLKVIDDKNKQNKLITTAYEHIIDNFSIDVSMKKYIVEWENLQSS